MAIMKVIEVLAQSEKSWEDAAREALEEASKSVRNIKSLYVKEMLAVIQPDGGIKFRLDAQITFEVDGDRLGEKRAERSARSTRNGDRGRLSIL
jgi:hypothetical protein